MRSAKRRDARATEKKAIQALGLNRDEIPVNKFRDTCKKFTMDYKEAADFSNWVKNNFGGISLSDTANYTANQDQDKKD